MNRNKKARLGEAAVKSSQNQIPPSYKRIET
jgi:hypothetical protein